MRPSRFARYVWAVLAYNLLVSQSEKIELGLTTAASELTDHLENAHGTGDLHHGDSPVSAIAHPSANLGKPQLG